MGVIVQLESAQAIKQLEAIAGVEGVDGLFIGPGISPPRWAMSARLAPGGDGSDVAGGAALQALGKPIGTIGGDPESVAQYRAAGFDFVAVGSDLACSCRARARPSPRCARPAASMCTRCRRARAVTERDRRSIAA